MDGMFDDFQADEYDQHDGQEVEAKQLEGFHPGHFHDRSPPSVPGVPPGGHRAVQFAGSVSCNGAPGHRLEAILDLFCCFAAELPLTLA